MTLDLAAYLSGLEMIATPGVALALVVGVLAGILGGALPGLTSTMVVALLLPLTFALDPATSFALLLGAYVGSIYGGSITAILVRIPGTPSSVTTVLDGYPMAQRGEAGRAIALATWASFFGGLGSALFLAAFSPAVANWAFEFGPQEFFAVAFMGVAVMAYISSGAMLKGLVSAALGLLVATVGADPLTGFPRFTGNQPAFLSGLELVPVFIGMFGLVEVMRLVGKPTPAAKLGATKGMKIRLPGFAELKPLLPLMFGAWIVGIFIGVVPAAGAAVASIVAYGIAKRVAKNRAQFGQGADEGIVVSETANNGSTGGDLLPTLTLGVPGDAVTAVLIGALMIHGLQPGPLLFRDHADIVAAIFLLLICANIVMLGAGLVGSKYFAKVVQIPRASLLPAILVLCLVGSYSLRQSYWDVALMITMGIVGYFLTLARVPIAPFVLALILGPLVETNFRRAMLVSGGDLTSFVTRPISAVLLGLTALLMLSPLAMRIFVGRASRLVEEVDVEEEISS